MKKNRTKHLSRNTEFPSGRSASTRKLTLPEVLVKVGRSLRDLVTGSGLREHSDHRVPVIVPSSRYLGFLALYDAVFAIISWASFEYVVTE